MSAIDRVAEITQLIEDLQDKYPAGINAFLGIFAEEFLPETRHG
ncbi:hypothetical protein [Acidithiobacillus ferriphilus]|nr:hypothetical protein [Acidithiobacillus ferriphilus]MEB8537403.1 hypothetical protein [Acidithiobacillus ferriphilus]